MKMLQQFGMTVDDINYFFIFLLINLADEH